MNTVDQLALVVPNYARVLEHWGDATNLREHYSALQTCYGNNQFGLVEHVKSFIEGVCITAIQEYGGALPTNQSITNYLNAALKCLGLEQARESEGIGELLSACSRFAGAITKVRNGQGPIAHGKDGFVESISNDLARSFLYTGDAILSLLLKSMEGELPDLRRTREPYEVERLQGIHQNIDQRVRVDARVLDEDDRQIVTLLIGTNFEGGPIDIRIEPSRLLYGVDREAYIEVLKVAQSIQESHDEEEPGLEHANERQKPELVSGKVEFAPIDIELEVSYTGSLASLSMEIASFLVSRDIPPESPLESGERLLDSLLATLDDERGIDWSEREVLLARMRTSVRKVLQRFGVEAGKASEMAEMLVEWLRTQPLARQARADELVS